MGATDPRIDAYIEKSAGFARPILAYLREVVHAACPEVEETMKWSFPHFVYRGGILCSMSSFKEHCAFGFWKGSLILDAGGRSTEAMGQFGRITRLDDLPPREVLEGYVREAMRLNDAGVKSPTRSKPAAAAKPEAAVPDDLAAALERSDLARATFERFPPSQRREYVEWITGAKTGATREKRLAQAIEWLAEGKPRNWKYMRA